MVWRGIALSPTQFLSGGSGLPGLEFHVHQRSMCPAVAIEPWHNFRSMVTNVLSCAFNEACAVPRSPYQLLAGIADQVAYSDVTEYVAKTMECALGFAAAMAIIILHAQLDDS